MLPDAHLVAAPGSPWQGSVLRPGRMPLEPYTLFDFEHVRATIQVVEDAIAREQEQTSDAIRAVPSRIRDLALVALEGDP